MATKLRQNQPIEADGDYYMKLQPGRRYFFRCKGDYGGGTLTAEDGDVSEGGVLSNEAAIAGASHSAAGESVLRFELAAVMRYINFNLNGATAPSIVITAVPESNLRG